MSIVKEGKMLCIKIMRESKARIKIKKNNNKKNKIKMQKKIQKFSGKFRKIFSGKFVEMWPYLNRKHKGCHFVELS